jgi:hypothetical protein
MVTHGRIVSLGTTNEGLVSFRRVLALAAGSLCQQLQEQVMEVVALYLILLFLYPEAVLLVTGLFVLVLAAAF